MVTANQILRFVTHANHFNRRQTLYSSSDKICPTSLHATILIHSTGCTIRHRVRPLGEFQDILSFRPFSFIPYLAINQTLAIFAYSLSYVFISPSYHTPQMKADNRKTTQPTIACALASHMTLHDVTLSCYIHMEKTNHISVVFFFCFITFPALFPINFVCFFILWRPLLV